MANDPKVVLGEEKQISMKDIFTQMSKDFIKHEEIPNRYNLSLVLLWDSKNRKYPF